MEDREGGVIVALGHIIEDLWLEPKSEMEKGKRDAS